MSNEKEWVAWPTQPGVYCVHGSINNAERAQKEGTAPKLQPCIAVLTAGDVIGVHCWSEFVYRSRSMGVFLPLDEPNTPDVSSKLGRQT